MGLNDLLLDSDLTEEQHDLAHGIKQSAAFLLTIINDILDFSKIESGHMDIEQVPFNLGEVITDLYKLMDVQAQRKGIALKYHYDFPSERDIIGDPGRVRQVLTNLLSNSIKFTEKGSVSLEVTAMPPDFLGNRGRGRSSSPTIYKNSIPSLLDPGTLLRTYSSDQTEADNASHDVLYLRFVIEDTGMGIDPDSMKKLFQPFLQADSSTARLHGGTGLGLNICKQLVRLMGGDIELASVPDQGTTATFHVPFRLSAETKEMSDEKMDVDTTAMAPPRDRLSPSSRSRANLRDHRDPLPRNGSPFKPVKPISKPPPRKPQLGQSQSMDDDTVMSGSSRPITPAVPGPPAKPHILIVEDKYVLIVKI